MKRVAQAFKGYVKSSRTGLAIVLGALDLLYSVTTMVFSREMLCEFVTRRFTERESVMRIG